MKNYKDIVWELALSAARSHYDGCILPKDKSVDTVAWVFEKTKKQVENDIAAVYQTACDKVLKG